MPRWRIYYEDREWSDDDGPPEQAPGWGVLCVVQLDPDVARVVTSGFDFYCLHEGDPAWWGHDLQGLYDCLSSPRRAVVRHGRVVATATYRRRLRDACADPEFPPPGAA